MLSDIKDEHKWWWDILLMTAQHKFNTEYNKVAKTEVGMILNPMDNRNDFRSCERCI